jgi:hypothetical protein
MHLINEEVDSDVRHCTRVLVNDCKGAHTLQHEVFASLDAHASDTHHDHLHLYEFGCGLGAECRVLAREAVEILCV